MAKSQFKNTLFNIPTTQMIVGTMREGKPTFMALAWVTRVNFKPALFAIGVNKANATHDAIMAAKEFSLSLPSTEMVAITDYTGLVSARNTDKSGIFDLFYGELQSAPMIRECPLTLSFTLHSIVDLPTNSLFIGELVESWCEESCLNEGRPDMTRIQPFCLTMPDNQFWALGEKAGDAWSAGKQLKRSHTDRES